MTAREAALAVLADVLSRGSYLNLALKALSLAPEEQRFATALVTETLEHLPAIDQVLSKKISLRKTNPVIINILRLGVCQLLYMNSVPDSAAVNESVRLAQKKVPRLKGLVNAVLRALAREEARPQWPDPSLGFADYLAERYSYPQWICALFCEQLGNDEAERLVSCKGTPGITSVRKTALASPDERFPDMRPGIYLNDAYRVKHAQDLAHSKLLTSGAFTVQSESSMLCVRALGLKRDAKLLDLCAAPGGKSAYAAQIAAEGHVTACDLHAHRVQLIEETARRLACANVTAEKWDATVFRPEWSDQFDFVLVDAPCSALGLAYRKPDIRLRREPADLEALAATQRQILTCAQRYVAPGGVLVYSTCTIDRLENEDVTAWFSENHPGFTRDGLGSRLPGPLQGRAAGGQIQLLPSRDGIDGFFISRFEKLETNPACFGRVDNSRQ